MFVFLVGMPGVGKTYWLSHFANALKIPEVDLDSYLEEATGKAIASIISEGENVFRQKEQQLLVSILQQYEQAVIATGGGTPCYKNNLEIMQQAGIIVYITLPLSQIMLQIKQAPGLRPLLKMDSDNELKESVIKTFQSRKLYYEQADLTFDPNQDNLSDIIQRIQQLKQQKHV